MLLFSKDPEKWQLGAYVKIGYFETDADLLYQDEIHGSILEQIDKIVELVYLKYMRAKSPMRGCSGSSGTLCRRKPCGKLC